MIGCNVTQPYVTNISPAGEQGILVKNVKCSLIRSPQKYQLKDVTPVMYGWVILQRKKIN